MNSQVPLSRLLDYDLWANRKILNALADHPSFEHRKKCLDLFHHVLGAQAMWQARIAGSDTSGIAIWPEPEQTNDETLMEQNHHKLRDILEQQEPAGSITYTNSSGKAFESKISDILHHIVIHGQHHRAQIAMLMRMSGIAPPATDYIFHMREL